jgi:uncharacterized protein (TIGR03118 family)
MPSPKRRAQIAGLIVLLVLLTTLTSASAATVAFKQTNLVSDGSAQANTIDANLKNPWGLAQGPSTPFWVANQVTNTSTLYDADGVPQPAGTPLVVSVPQVRPDPQGPTGLVFNGTSDFVVTKAPNSGPAAFIFVGLDGSISGWNPTVDPTNAITAVNDSDRSIFTGATLANSGGSNRLYIANGLAGTVDVKGPDFQPVTPSGTFTDPATPQGLVPFNVRELGGKIYVTYAVPGEEADEEEEGSGSVSVYDTEGNLLKHLTDGGHLASPWGLALAPQGFGDFGGALLVGNFNEEGHINAFNPDTGEFLGTVSDVNGQPLENDELWSLQFGTGGGGSSPNTLYLTAGINDEAGGLFAKIETTSGPPVIPLPAAVCVAPPVLALALRLATRKTPRN